MKRFLVFLAFVFTIIAARADFVIKQKMEGALQGGDVTIQIKGDRVRMDMAAGPMGDMSTILDLSTGDSVVLMHKQKMAMKVPGAQMKQMMEMMKKQMGNASAEPPKPQATGKTEKIGDYQTEIYTWSNSTGMSATLWVAKDFPNYKKINEQLDRLSKSAAGGMGKGMGPDLGTLPGMLVKSEEAVLGQKVTTTLVSAKEAPVDDSVFETPKDYHEMTQPVAGSRKEAQPKAAPKMEQKLDDPAKVRAALVEGTKFPDFDAEDIYRKPLALANYKGKVVLIDFWATWCRPYVTELPRLLRTYEKYHDQGFEIIGINLDQEEGSLTAFIRQNRMTWQQYFDGQVWASKLAVKYGIEDLPANFLLDGEGMIIGKDLLGEALEKALAGALKKK